MEHDPIAAPVPSERVTVPRGVPAAVESETVNVTDSPYVVAARLEASVSDVVARSTVWVAVPWLAWTFALPRK
jgi:hypothetical protein